MNPYLSECFADNGQHSHWQVIDKTTGEVIVADIESLVPTKAQEHSNKVGQAKSGGFCPYCGGTNGIHHLFVSA